MKEGVGLVIDTERTVNAARSRSAPRRPVGTEIYESSGAPPDSLEGWGAPVATVKNGGGIETVQLPDRSAQSFLIWITKQPSARDDPDRFQMEISDVRLLS